jgi:hypothetical protein
MKIKKELSDLTFDILSFQFNRDQKRFLNISNENSKRSNKIFSDNFDIQKIFIISLFLSQK